MGDHIQCPIYDFLRAEEQEHHRRDEEWRRRHPPTDPVRRGWREYLRRPSHTGPQFGPEHGPTPRFNPPPRFGSQYGLRCSARPGGYHPQYHPVPSALPAGPGAFAGPGPHESAYHYIGVMFGRNSTDYNLICKNLKILWETTRQLNTNIQEYHAQHSKDWLSWYKDNRLDDIAKFYQARAETAKKIERWAKDAERSVRERLRRHPNLYQKKDIGDFNAQLQKLKRHTDKVAEVFQQIVAKVYKFISDLDDVPDRLKEKKVPHLIDKVNQIHDLIVDILSDVHVQAGMLINGHYE